MSRLIILIKRYGILGLMKKGIQSYLGISKQQESIDSLYFYLNNYLIKASELPPTNDTNLRIMQKCDVELLKILDNICKRHTESAPPETPTTTVSPAFIILFSFI